MLLPIEKIKHVNSINHEGKIVIVVCDKDGTLFYSVRQEGHEDNYDKTALKGWEDWSLLPIPDQGADQSVLDNEKKEFSTNDGVKILRSVYQTKESTAVAPVQLISGLSHIYIFRQQKNGKIAVDRFVLDGMTNKLVPKLQVRFKRSRQRFEPKRKDKKGREVMDSYDFRDANNKHFLEPSTELTYLPKTMDGWFTVVLLPTKEADRFRWHIFIYNLETKRLELWSIASSEDGLFDIRDKGTNAGLLKREFYLESGVTITQGPAATKYDVQFERMTEAGPQLLRDKIRVMLVVPTSKEDMALAVNFSVDTNGFLSQIGDPQTQDVLNSYTRNILLPINSLDEIKGIAQDKAAGVIDAISKGKEDEVWIETDPDSLPEMGDEVEISGTKDFNGLHQVVKATKNTIMIEEVVNKLGDEKIKLGRWEQKIDPNESLLFDGMVTSYRKMAGNSIRITSPKHGLKKGDQLQLIGSEEIDGVFGVQDIKKDSFSIGLKWTNSQIINIRLKSKQRRGIHFDAVGDAVLTPELPLNNATLPFTTARTVTAWVYPEDLANGTQFIAGNDYGILQLLLVDGVMTAAFNIGKDSSDSIDQILLKEETTMKPEWTHYAASYYFDEKTQHTNLRLMRDGMIVAEEKVKGRPIPTVNAALQFDGNPEGMLVAENNAFFDFKKTDYTLECWSRTSSGGPLISKSAYDDKYGNKGTRQLTIDNDGRVVFSIDEEKQYQSFTKVNDNKWHHIAVVYNLRQDKHSLFIDGKEEQLLVPRTITGTIKTKDGKALKGAVVTIERQTKTPGIFETFTATSDPEGKFSISATQGERMSIIYEGFVTEERSIGGQNSLEIIMVKDSEAHMNISGFVTEANGRPLIGVTVLVKGTTNGAWTDFDGAFSLRANWNDVLVISYVGFVTKEVKVTSNRLNVILLEGVYDVLNFMIIGGERKEQTFDVEIDEVRLWKSARSEKELLAQKDQRLSGLELYLMGYWNFEEVEKKEIKIGGDTIEAYAVANKATHPNSLYSLRPFNQVKSPIYKTHKLKERYYFGGTQEESPLYKNFRGKLSNLQIWNKALQEKTVRDGMHLELRGTESDLAVYYPMGGIIKNEIIDFTVNKLHAEVFGNPYYSERTLSRYVLGDKPIEMFRNDEMIAVTQGAKYEESFEFRLLKADGTYLDPGEVGGVNAFEFYLWGKENHSDEGEEFDAEKLLSQVINEPKGEGWYKATCQFVVPDTIRLLRVFGLKKVEGAVEDWINMEVRKHQLTFYADSISLAPFEDKLDDLTSLADPGVDLGDLPRLEQLKRRYLSEKETVEARLNTLKTFSNNENLILDRIRFLEGSNSPIGKNVEARKKRYQNPLSYYCKIYKNSFWGNRYLTPPDADVGIMKLTTVLVEHLAQDGGKHYWWEFREMSPGRYYIYRYKYPSNSARPHLIRYNNVDPYRVDLAFGTELKEIRDRNARGFSAYLFDLKIHYLWDDGGRLVTNEKSKTNKTRWKIEIGHKKVMTPSAKKIIDNFDKSINRLRNELKTLKERSKWQTMLNNINVKLEELEIKINLIINEFNATVVDQFIPDEMPQLAEDRNGLVSRAAYLSFAKAASRLNIIESCEGNLLLSYFDTNGRMRQTIFDATADSRNSTFQQWLPETVKSCLDFSANDRSEVLLNEPIELGENWTIEFWFTYPLPSAIDEDGKMKDLHLFIGGDQQSLVAWDSHFMKSSPAAVYNHSEDVQGVKRIVTKELGIYHRQVATTEEGEVKLDFLGTGFDMEDLSHGWHHLAVQGTGTEGGGTVTFFIDGKKAGEDVRSNFFNKEANEGKQKLLKDFSFNYNGKIRGIGNAVWTDPEDSLNGGVPTEIDEDHLLKTNDYKVSKMAEVRLWDVLLSPEEIEINSRTYLSGNEPGLVAYYPLSEGMGDVIKNHAAHYTLEQDMDGEMQNARWMPSTAPIGHPGDHAVYFDGKNDVIRFEEKLQVPEDYTIEFWFKAKDLKNENLESQFYSLFDLSAFDPTSRFYAGLYLVVHGTRLDFFHDHGSGHSERFDLNKSISDNSWHHIALAIDNTNLYFYFDGKMVGDGPSVLNNGVQFDEDRKFSFNNLEASLTLGGINPFGQRMNSYPAFNGEMADFRLWNYQRSQSDIQKMRFRRLIGNEDGLMLYCPLDSITEDHKVINFASKNYGKTVASDSHHTRVKYTNDLPIGLDAVIISEYPTVAFDPETNKQTAMMWRSFMTPKVDKLHLLTNKRIELLEYIWVGNGQFDPTLLGYIEGAPPVPSENLTEEADYSDATSVELSVADNVEFSWERTQNIYTELDLDAKIGAEAESTIGSAVGIGAQAVVLKKVGFESLFGVRANFQYGAQDATEISTSSTLNFSDSLGLRGYQEEEAAFENLGQRFVPKNIGYALVISSTADVFIVRLKRSKKMVSYKILPVKDVPPQINTITFLMNPSYTLAGSLDGQVGTNAADDRFYSHVPEMRAQFGSKYPASYMRLDQATKLQSIIERMDKEREAYFQNFNARLVDETSLNTEIGDTSDTGPSIDLGDASGDGEMENKEDEIKNASEDSESQTKEVKSKANKSVDKYQGMASSSASETGMFSWKKKMESLQIKAGKRNIVNSYVWDADGGLHIQNQSFANTISHSIGGSFSFSGGLNTDIEFKLGVAIELAIEAGVGVELTMSKTESRSKEVALNVDMGGMEHRGITDHKDRPLMPGEKVDRYRFSSFFLEGNSNHFNDFFNYVVDPEWLASNDEEARALRQVNISKPNKTWRILHRVTYVERPALMGFGNDTRPLLNTEEENDLLTQVERIDNNVKDVETNTNQLKRKIAHLEEALKTAKAQNDAITGKLETILTLLRAEQGENIV